MLSLEERQKLMAENPPEVTCAHWSNVYFDWSWDGCGFGQLSISLDREKMELTAMNECMSRESVRKILHAYADYIADRVVLLDNVDDVPPIDFKAEQEKFHQDHLDWVNGRKAAIEQKKKQ